MAIEATKTFATAAEARIALNAVAVPALNQVSEVLAQVGDLRARAADSFSKSSNGPSLQAEFDPHLNFFEQLVQGFVRLGSSIALDLPLGEAVARSGGEAAFIKDANEAISDYERVQRICANGLSMLETQLLSVIMVDAIAEPRGRSFHHHPLTPDEMRAVANLPR